MEGGAREAPVWGERIMRGRLWGLRKRVQEVMLNDQCMGAKVAGIELLLICEKLVSEFMKPKLTTGHEQSKGPASQKS